MCHPVAIFGGKEKKRKKVFLSDFFFRALPSDPVGTRWYSLLVLAGTCRSSLLIAGTCCCYSLVLAAGTRWYSLVLLAAGARWWYSLLVLAGGTRC